MISDRKLEHLLICENYDVEFKNKTTGFEDIELIHNVLPEIDKNEIDLSTSAFGKKLDSPLFITAITGGHPAAKEVNRQLAIAAPFTPLNTLERYRLYSFISCFWVGYSIFPYRSRSISMQAGPQVSMLCCL